MRILYITTVGKTMNFFISLISELLDEDFDVDIAANQLYGESPFPEVYEKLGCKKFDIDCVRKPLSLSNIRAIRQIRKIVENGEYDIVHCHTPIAALCTRVACQKYRKQGLKVFYTAHGFHFYKGAPLKNWLLFYPVEWIASWVTDILITINREDYTLAKKHFHANSTVLIPGVGIDTERFDVDDFNRDSFLDSLKVPSDAFVISSVGELNKNKNHEVIIRALSVLNNSTVHYLIAGEGPLRDYLLDLSYSLGLKDNVHLLGFRKDIPQVYKASDICVFPSIREGQGLAAIEGMAAGLPLIVSNNRGLRDIVSKDNAIICPFDDVFSFADALRQLINSPSLRNLMGSKNKELSTMFSTRMINEQILQLYDQC